MSTYDLLKARRVLENPVLVHVPHSSTVIPPDVRGCFVLGDDDLQSELLAMTDHYVDELFSEALALGATMIVNRVSRLVSDPERFPNAKDEPMAAKGMGAVYTRTSDGRPLRPASFGQGERLYIMRQFFEPYAAAVERQVRLLLKRFGWCLIVDAHSYPSRPLPYEDVSLTRPDICLGYDYYHVPRGIVEQWAVRCQEAGWTVVFNEPFSGSYVPLRFYRKDSRVRSAMIEIKRSTYMDEVTGSRLPRFGEAQRLAGDLLTIAIATI